MTVLSVCDSDVLEQRISSFVAKCEDNPVLRAAVHDIQDALANEEHTSWVTVYDSLELIVFATSGATHDQATILLNLIEGNGLVRGLAS